MSKYGQNEYSRALNASYTFQPLWVSGSTDVVKINTDIDLTSSTFSGISIGIKVFSTKA